MKNQKIWILCWLGCLLLSSFSAKAAIELRSERLTTADGLANNSVRYIYQDSKGFIWMATLNGLNRYDGNSLITFRPQKSKKISLADHRVKVLEEDQNGFLWITTTADLISCYDLRHDCFVDFTGCGEYQDHYRGFFITEEAVWLWGASHGCRRVTYQDGRFTSTSFTVQNGSLKSNNVHFIRQHGDRVWIGTQQGVYYWKDNKLVAVDESHSYWKAMFYEDNLVFVTSEGDLFYFQTDGKLKSLGSLPRKTKKWAMTGLFRIGQKQYILTSEGTLCLDMKTFKVESAPAYYNIPEGQVKKDDKGDYWVYNRTGNLYYIKSDTGEKKVFSVMPYDKLGFIDKERYYIVHDSRGIIWISTYGNGLFAYDPATESIQHFTSDSGISSLLASNYLQCLMEDRSGSVWVSSEFAGISKLSVLNEGASRVYPEKDSMADRSNTVRMIASTSDGDIWVGTRSGGLYIYDAKLEVQKKKFHHDINTYAVCEDNEGNLWIATRGEGVWIGDVKYRYDKLNDKSLSSDNVFCMLKDRKGRMWIGTFGGGLNLAVPTQDGKYEFRHFFTRTNGQRETRTLCEDSNGWIWVGSSEGIFVFDPDKLIADPEAYKHYSLESGDLQSNDIRAIIRDRKGHMWLAESGAGFGMSVVGHNYDKLEFTHYTSQDGLVSSMVQALIEDDKGMIWVSTEYGFSFFNPETVTFENYLFSDYILGNVYSENSVLKLQDGRLALGTGQGIVIVDPKHVSVKDTPMQVTFTDLKLNGISVIPGDKDSPFFTMLINMAVPVFMIISGYNFAMSNRKKTGGNLKKMYAWEMIKPKLIRFLVPFFTVCLIEIVLLVIEDKHINPPRIFLLGAYGPGSYYVPIMIQLLVIFPVIYKLVEKNARLGIALSGAANLLFEIGVKIFDMDKYYYRLNIGRYLLLIAFGCYLYLYPEHRVKKYQLISMFLIGLGYIVAVFGFNWDIILFGYWKTTAMPIAFYIFPIIILLFRRYYHIKLPGVIGNTLTWIGQASYHIFLVQMVYYHFELGGRLMASTWYIALPFNILVTVAAGLAFYEADCRFIRNMKYLKFKAKRRVA